MNSISFFRSAFLSIGVIVLVDLLSHQTGSFSGMLPVGMDEFIMSLLIVKSLFINADSPE